MTIYYDRTPYTYLIGWSAQNMWYYGRRTKKGCNPDDLWKKYFTSSGEVRKFRKTHGEPDIVQVRKIFVGPDAARACTKHEVGVIRRMGAVASPHWLNKGNAGIEFDTTGKIIGKDPNTGKSVIIDANDFQRESIVGINYGITFAKLPCLHCNKQVAINNFPQHLRYCEFNPTKEQHPLKGFRHSKEARLNMIAGHADVDQRGNQNPNAKQWKLTSPSGETFTINGSLNQTLAEKGLSRNHLVKNLGKVVSRPYTVRSLLTKNTIGWKLEPTT